MERQRHRNTIQSKNIATFRKVMDFVKVQQFIEVVGKLPGFNMRITEEQKIVIGYDGNIILSGSSGTGKTTCAVLRLLTVQMLFHIRQKLGSERFEIIDSRCGKKPIGLHSVFTAASRCLVKEMERYYHRFAYEIKRRTAKKRGQDFEQVPPEQPDRTAIQELKDGMFEIRSLAQLSETEYPAFLTTKQMLFAIDGSLPRPFFDGKPHLSSDSKYSCQQTTVRISNYTAKMNPVDLTSQRDRSESKKPQRFNVYEQFQSNEYTESTYELFAVEFWSQAKSQFSNHLRPEELWTQITTIIKGSVKSHQFPRFALPEREYIESSNHQKAKQIYQAYLLYQQWKQHANVYDVMDAVNYCLYWIDISGYTGSPIHYLTVDDVQDIPSAFVKLLVSVTEIGVLFSGDLLQTLSKGFNFYLTNLQNIFQEEESSKTALILQRPQHLQLTQNFRSQNSLLRLSNSVVAIMELLFPGSIDKMGKERSKYNGSRSVLLSGMDDFELVLEFMESDISQCTGSEGRSPLGFGFHKAVLVQDAECKKHLPAQLLEYVCMTIEQARGLEFYDVLLYNFFERSRVPSLWRFLDWLKVKTSEGSGQRNLYLERAFSAEERNKIQELCWELKTLYVAITRTRNNLWVYDESDDVRKPTERIWFQMGVVQTVQDFYTRKEEPSARELVMGISKEQWRQQGKVMLARGVTEQAIKCFRNSGDEKLVLRIEGKAMADRAAKALAEAESGLANLHSQPTPVRRRQQLENTKAEALSDLRKAGSMFTQVQDFKSAGKCFFSGQDYETAAQCFGRIEMHKEQGDCYAAVRKYIEAALCYLRGPNSQLVLKVLDAAHAYEAALGLIHHFRQTLRDIQKLVQHYFDKAINKLNAETCLVEPACPLMQASKAYTQLLEWLRERKIVLQGDTSDRYLQRAIQLIAIKSRYLQLEVEKLGNPGGYIRFLNALFQEEEFRDFTNEEITLQELWMSKHYTLCLSLCQRNSSMSFRVPYYGLMYAESRLTIPEWQLGQNDRRVIMWRTNLSQTQREIDPTLQMVERHVYQQHFPKELRLYYLHRLILIGLYKRIPQVERNSESIAELCYAYFDLELLLTHLPIQSFRQIGVHPLAVALTLERLQWESYDRTHKRPPMDRLACLALQLPSNFVYGIKFFQSPSEDLVNEAQQKSLVKDCVADFCRVVSGTPDDEQKVRDTMAGVFHIVYSRGLQLVKHLNTTEMLQLYCGLKSLVKGMMTADAKLHLNRWIMVEALLSFYRLRFPKRNRRCELLDFLGDETLYMHVSSPIKADLVRWVDRNNRRRLQQSIHFADCQLQVLAVPLQPTITILRKHLLKQLDNIVRLFCVTPNPRMATHSDYNQRVFKKVLCHLYGMNHQFTSDGLSWLFLMSRTTMPAVLSSHLLKLGTRSAHKRPRWKSHVLLLASNHMPTNQPSPNSLCNMLKYRHQYDLNGYQNCFESVLNSSLWLNHSQLLLLVVEQLLILLLQKYLLAGGRQLKLILIESQLIFFQQLTVWRNGNHSGSCLDQYQYSREPAHIYNRILYYFAQLRQCVRRLRHKLSQEQLNRIKNIVFVFILNLHGRQLCNRTLHAHYLGILRSCGLLKSFILEFKTIIAQQPNKQGSLLAQFIKEYSQPTYEVTFVDVSDSAEMEATRKLLRMTEKQQRINKNKAATKIQRWWRSLTAINFPRSNHQSYSIIDNYELANRFYALRRPNVSSDFLHRVNRVRRRLLASIRAQLVYPAERRCLVDSQIRSALLERLQQLDSQSSRRGQMLKQLQEQLDNIIQILDELPRVDTYDSRRTTILEIGQPSGILKSRW